MAVRSPSWTTRFVSIAAAAGLLVAAGCSSDDKKDDAADNSAATSISAGNTSSGLDDKGLSPADNDTEHVIKTDQGEIKVPGDPKKIVVLAGSQADYLYALGAPVTATDTRVVGINEYKPDQFPDEWAAAAQKQGSKALLPSGNDLNIEAIAGFKPDLIVGGGQGLPAVLAAKAYPQLSKIAPTVLVPKTAIDWRQQLSIVADAVNRKSRVPALLAAYDAKVAEVKSAITVPQGPFAYFYAYTGGKNYVVPETAALPQLLKQVGFEPDTVYEKAGKPELASTGDAFLLSTENVSKTLDAPGIFVLKLSTDSTVDKVKSLPAFASLPAIAGGKAWELPAGSYRPDYTNALATLDLIKQTFAK